MFTYEEILKEIGMTVNYLRVSHGISQEKLAELADMSTTFICTLEAGNCNNPEFRSLWKVATALGLPHPALLYSRLSCKMWNLMGIQNCIDQHSMMIAAEDVQPATNWQKNQMKLILQMLQVMGPLTDTLARDDFKKYLNDMP